MQHFCFWLRSKTMNTKLLLYYHATHFFCIKLWNVGPLPFNVRSCWILAGSGLRYDYGYGNMVMYEPCELPPHTVNKSEEASHSQ